MANKNPNTGPLLKNIEQKKQRTILKVENTIKEMIKKKIKINFNSIATESGVSKSFLYKYDDLRNRIETLRKNQGTVKSKQTNCEVTARSKDVIITSLRKRNQQLEEENKRLKEQLKMDFSAIYNQID